MNAAMPFDGNTSEAAIVTWLTNRLDRLERIIDENNTAINARISQIENRLLIPPRVELDSWRATLLVVSIVVAIISVMAAVYVGGSFGG